MKKLKAIDFFCGGGGMTYGLNQSGINVLAGIDIDENCKETYEFNNRNSKFLHKDITQFNPIDLEKELKIKKNDNRMIFIGCSPCQYWSIINTNKEKSSKSKDLLADFGRFVEYFIPGYILIENVPGILNKKSESPLKNFLDLLDKYNYNYHYDIINMNDYGVPQKRKRFSLIASRIKEIKLPKKDNQKLVLKNIIGEENGFPKIPAGYKDSTEYFHTTAGLSETNLLRIKQTNRNGGQRRDWKDDENLQLKAYIGKDKDFSDNYSRMSWDKPSPTITTKFCSLSNGRFGHPEEDRALSIREGASLQTFPKEYIFKTKSIGHAAKIIGNAVPPEFARRLGENLVNMVRNENVSTS